jgi:hypothetical protein
LEQDDIEVAIPVDVDKPTARGGALNKVEALSTNPCVGGEVDTCLLGDIYKKG